MLDTTAVQSPPRRQRTLQKLVVFGDDANNYKDIFASLQQRNVATTFLKSFDDFKGELDDVTFFCGNFNTPLFNIINKQQVNNLEAPSQLVVVGPAVLRHRLAKKMELMTLRPCRPLYCEIMRNVTMVISPEVLNKREIVDLVHYMGGSVRKEPVSKTNVLIAARACGRLYGAMSLLGQPILRSDWVNHCWSQRDNADFDVFNEELLKQFRIAVFEGLHIFFHGFRQKEVDDMAKHLQDNKGKMVKQTNEATHVVYNSDAMELEPLPASGHLLHVTQEWFWVSLHMGKCAREDSYALPTRNLKKKIVCGSSMNSPAGKLALSKSASSVREYGDDVVSSLNATPDYIYSNDEMEKMGRSPRPTSKRLQVCMEMAETENNYLNALKLLLKFKAALEHEVSQNEFMKKTDIALMFGKLEPIVEVHGRISEKLNAMVAEATSAAASGHSKKSDEKNLDPAAVWVEAKEEMIRVYPPYLNLYDNAKKLFDTIDRENAKFHAFCKAKESNPDFKRQKVVDILVRPVQRLPSVILLLREVGKKSESSRMKLSSDEAVKVIDEVLKIANKTRERNDHLISHMNKFTDIENVPIHLMAANRMFIRDINIVPVASTAPKLLKDCKMKLFLFHDVLLVTKIRQDKGTMQRLARHASFASLHARARRPYKYVDQLPLASLRSACRIRPPLDFCQDPALGEPVLWLITHRDNLDHQWVIESKDDESMREFMDDIHMKVLSEYGRYFMSCSEETANSIFESDIADAVTRYFKRQMPVSNANMTMVERTPRGDWSQASSINDSTFSTATHQSQQSKMRRAFSNAQLQIATTFGFGRAQSRVNLGQISETSVCQTPRAVASSSTESAANSTISATPKRGLRQRLTSSTFLSRTLNRNTSMRCSQATLPPLEDEKENRTMVERPTHSGSRVTDV
ncbi:unnamed protein product [Caenorhabditis auriculariae]|uniref:Uncharacterized protein n=1 Tax=Caenorhabditis auriculariae TaxID=2777116 RepID=A0A8S1HCT1_9PELO|nr:unnamed protein product [Caenorhabditis auriculariae]